MHRPSRETGPSWWLLLPAVLLALAHTLRGKKRSVPSLGKQVAHPSRLPHLLALLLGVVATTAGASRLIQPSLPPPPPTSGRLILWVDDRIPDPDIFISFAGANDPYFRYDTWRGFGGRTSSSSNIVGKEGKFGRTTSRDSLCRLELCSPNPWRELGSPGPPDPFVKMAIHIESSSANIPPGDPPPFAMLPNFDSATNPLSDTVIPRHEDEACPNLQDPEFTITDETPDSVGHITTTVGCTDEGNWIIEIEAGLRRPAIVSRQGRVVGALPTVVVQKMPFTQCRQVFGMGPNVDTCVPEAIRPAPFTVEAMIAGLSHPEILPTYIDQAISPAPTRPNALRWSSPGQSASILDSAVSPTWTAVDVASANAERRLDQLMTILVALGASLVVSAALELIRYSYDR